MTYNQKRHIELLKRSQDLSNQGKNIFIENKEEGLELSMYNKDVAQHIFWQYRYQVALLMEDFLNKKINGEEFCGQVDGIRRKLRNECKKFHLELMSGSEKLKDFKPDEKAKTLKGFLTGLYCQCENFEEDYENEEFYISITNGFLNFQEALNEE